MSRIESFISTFSTEAPADEQVHRIEIPLIQRDYAQGRRGTKVDEIRESFLDVLYSALVGPVPQRVSLDFIYGEIEDGTLQPLDGQQRLTTLFLLHWYIASSANALEEDAPWTRFSYATRQSARRFCERLVSSTPPHDVTSLSEWIIDQSWYLFVWRHDPTIQAMLVMLDAIHQRFSTVDASDVWKRLSRTDDPAVTFHLLPLPDMGSAEDLYIKMNSRGKPLTDFENFKAHFEKIIAWSPDSSEFARKIDIEWVDIFWRFRGTDDLIDDEILRYFEFVVEVCEWSDTDISSDSRISLVKRANRVFGEDNADRETHLQFLFASFEAWVGRDAVDVFNQFFEVAAESASAGTKIPLFFRNSGVNLFESCCRSYGERSGSTRVFTFGQTLLLVAVVLHLVHGSDEFPRRVRILRNLIEGSTDEIRAERMPRLLADTKQLILTGELPAQGLGFGVPQVQDEEIKMDLRSANVEIIQTLDGLEDHPLLRGTLSGFDLDSDKLEQRAEAFRQITDADDLWIETAGALLTFGEYQRPRGRYPQNPRSFQFITPNGNFRDVWRLLLTGAAQEDLAPTRHVFANFLDAIATSTVPLEETFRAFQSEWLTEREATNELDWRYYMVKYPDMRSGGSGIYFTVGGKLGYSLCNLRGNTTQMNSQYRDPYLLSIWRQLGEPEALEDPWFNGYEWNPRYLKLQSSGIRVQSLSEGFQILIPEEYNSADIFEELFSELGIGEDGFLPVEQEQIEGSLIDTQDRIQVGTNLLQELISKGL